jgi:hypothetical protein
MARPTLSLEELTPEQRAAVRQATGRKRLPARRTFTADLERRYALRILAPISELTQDQRRRVLRRASKVNEV